jgi:hypothetical protein
MTMNHAWLATQTASLTFFWFILQRCHYFKVKLQDGRQMIWKEAVVPNQGIPVFTLNVRTNL